MRILVTGATGFIGGALARRLASEGKKTVALVRSPDSRAAKELEQAAIHLCQGSCLL